MRRFLAYFRPDAGLIMETEVWPNLVHVTRRVGVPLFLVNARLSPRSYRRTARFGKAAALLYNDFTMVLAQTAGDAERYRALGVRSVQITGNLKFDMQPPEAGVARGQFLRRAFGNRHVLAAASTREGEEPLILEAFARWPGADRPALLLVPRHPQRFDEVAAMAARAGFSVQRRSALDIEQLASPITADVVLGDSMGEMAMYYAASDIAYIGGSLIPLGGQNLIEACAVGTPVLMGPHTFNFAQATEDAIAAGACERVANADELMAAAAVMLGDEARLADKRAHALTFAGLHRGATARTLGALAPVLR